MFDPTLWNDNELKVIDILCNNFRISNEFMFAKTRKREAAHARHLFSYWLRMSTSLSLNGIGKLIGSKDHTTVIHSIKAAKDLIDTEPDKKELWNEISQLLSYRTKHHTITAMGKNPQFNSKNEMSI